MPDKNLANICSVTLSKNNNTVFAIDDLSFFKLKHRGSDIIIADTSGIVQTRFGRSGFYNGPVCWYHDITIDNEQSIYVGDILGNQIQKFKKITSH
jgi:peptidylamidoglycolate lyase